MYVWFLIASAFYDSSTKQFVPITSLLEGSIIIIILWILKESIKQKLLVFERSILRRNFGQTNE